MKLVLTMVLAAGGFSVVENVDGVKVEERAVEGSNFKELRFTAHSSASVETLCQAAYGDGSVPRADASQVKRKVLKESANERVTYDQRKAPIVSQRDYAVRWKKVTSGESCTVFFETANELAPPLPEGWVRVAKIKGSWKFTKNGDQTDIEYVSYSEPGGDIPAFVSEGPRRTLELGVMKTLLKTASL
ncbi:MAG: hypothetical protein ACO1OB_29695 [Archangium sp.]